MSTDTVTEDFIKIVNDFVADILRTFPEYSDAIATWWGQPAEQRYLYLLKHCQIVYPPHIFNILYKNEEAFSGTAPPPQDMLDFLPGIDFRAIFSCTNITEQTRATLWNYLNLVLFSILGTIKDGGAFGEDAGNLFGAISPEEMQAKMTAAISDMQSFFTEAASTANADQGAASAGQQSSPTGEYNVPNAETMQSHLNTLLGGKIGKFAEEIALEWADELGVDLEVREGEDGSEQTKKMMSALMGSPSKLYALFSKIGKRFKEKVESGELSEKEAQKEARELLAKFKDFKIPGMESVTGMLSTMVSAMGGGGRGIGASLAAAAAMPNIKRQMAYEEMKEKLRISRERMAKKKENTAAPIIITAPPKYTDDELAAIFNTKPAPPSRRHHGGSSKK